MRGHIARKGNRYYVVIDEDRDPAGKRKQRWHPAGATRKEAEGKLTRILSRLQDGSYTAPTRQTLATFLEDEWLPAMRTRLRPGTLALYEVTTRAYMVPHIGDVRLQALTPAQLNRLYATLLDKGGRTGKGLSAKTVRNTHTMVHRALTDAVRWGRVTRNVAELADPPKALRPEMKTWTADELRIYLRSVRSHRFYAAWLIAGTTGLRRGEILGLHWRDVDLEAARLSIRSTLVMVDNAPIWSEPKTAKGRRSVPLPAETVAALRAHRAHQLKERLALGTGYQDEDLVFCREDGATFHPDTFERTFDRLAAQAGLPPIRLHDLRHTFATLALQAAVHPKVVSEILGHASIAITLDTYSHAIPAMQEEAATRIAALFLGPG
jgi:integrase